MVMRRKLARPSDTRRGVTCDDVPTDLAGVVPDSDVTQLVRLVDRATT